MRPKLLKLRAETKTNQAQMARIIGKSQPIYSRKENKEMWFNEFEMKEIGKYFNLSKEETIALFFED
ncbi:hypothetical protein [Erysipelothrix anatis]|uniref:hypothetical protein n=1 Tax=Erysipelothrix anatis TaxID=2683713 RepID=UPI00135B659B|nr:hypothetical protein [Erysipelothrix anatis]